MRVATSETAGLVGAVAASLPGAASYRYRTHYAANLISANLISATDPPSPPEIGKEIAAPHPLR